MRETLEFRYLCGHPGRYEFVGDIRKRRRVLWRLQQSLCDDCILARLAEENKTPAERSAEVGLPPLEGKEATLDWAESLRWKAWGYIDDMRDCGDPDNPADAIWYEAIDYVRDEFFKETSAKYFLDHKTTLWNEMRRMLKKRVAELKQKAAGVAAAKPQKKRKAPPNGSALSHSV